MQKVLKSLGPATAIIGAQWGDEGKGKIIDILSGHFDIIARASGGANAGHTIIREGKQHVFHLLPSGCFHEGKTIILGSGMVIHLPTLLEEIRTLKDAGVDVLPRLKISHAAHIVFEEHKKHDSASEAQRAEAALGTTLRGIGPAYADKASRTGVRMEELLKEDVNNEELREAKEVLGSCVTKEIVPFLDEARKKGWRILIEGPQGTLLDIDHGTYPYVTSTATTSSGALHGLGLPPQALTSCIGVVKAYCTRVGGGPFLTEADEQRANKLRERGGEYGATTKRPRRCGWLSIPDLKFATQVNGFTHLNLTKLDVLDEEEMIPVFYKGGLNEWPGWKESTRGKTKLEDLPKNAQKYIQFIEEQVGVPVAFIGTGPGREEMIVR